MQLLEHTCRCTNCRTGPGTGTTPAMYKDPGNFCATLQCYKYGMDDRLVRLRCSHCTVVFCASDLPIYFTTSLYLRIVRL